jgi:hypothetical protein
MAGARSVESAMAGARSAMAGVGAAESAMVGVGSTGSAMAGAGRRWGAGTGRRWARGLAGRGRRRGESATGRSSPGAVGEREGGSGRSKMTLRGCARAVSVWSNKASGRPCGRARVRGGSVCAAGLEDAGMERSLYLIKSTKIN